MLFLHGVHKVDGNRADEFEEAFRKGLMPALAGGDDARLLWYCKLRDGQRRFVQCSYATAVRDGAAWERLALRFHDGQSKSNHLLGRGLFGTTL